ncbi:MAG: hypothetical protein L3J58_11855 [Emcibacter sp.]|nr:hypothetical protein [Emcibacter sp.]
MTRLDHTIQAAFTNGELNEELTFREDIEVYYKGAAEMTNVYLLTPGGFRRRPALSFDARLRNQLDSISLSGATITTPNGGTAANLIDGDVDTLSTTTTNVGVIDPYVVFHIDLLAGTVVDFVDVEGFKLSSGALDDEFRMQSSVDGAVWVDFGGTFNMADTARNRRRSIGAGSAVTARYWRFVRIGSTAIATTVDVGEVSFFVENAALATIELLSFVQSDEAQYIMAVTDQNIDVFKAGIYVGSARVPHGDAVISTVSWTQSLDTLLLFHKLHAPFRLFRQGSDDEWDFRDQTFKNIPQFDYGDTIGGTNEVQIIRFFDYVAGETFNIFLDTERTSSITFAASITTTASSIQAALRALPNTSATGISCVGSGAEVTVTFAGDDGKTNWPEILAAILTTVAGVVLVSTVTEGKEPGEDIISTARGWPRCGTFHDQRLWMAGFGSLPSHLMYSKAGKFFDFNDKTTRDDNAAVFTADTNKASVIYQLFPAQHLQIFTSSIEFYSPIQPITPLTTSAKKATAHGIPEGVRALDLEGATLFLQKDGGTVREYLFDDGQQNYKAPPVSLLASHMIKNITGTASQSGRETTDTDLVAFVNGTDELTLLSSMRSQNITAFVRARTKGKFLSAAAEDIGDLYVAVERVVNGAPVRYLEHFSEGRFLDSSIVVAAAPDTTIIAGLEHLEGLVVDIIIDRSYEGQVTVLAGQITLPVAAQETVEVGLNYRPRVKLMPVRNKLPDGTSIGRKKRIVKVITALKETSSLTVAVNGGPAQNIIFREFGDNLLDVPQFDQAFTGIKETAGGLGWKEEVEVIFEQIDPGPMTVLGVTQRVAV